jgi:hypothetical protein
MVMHMTTAHMTTGLMTTGLTLADLTGRTGFDVLGHLEREVTIPVTDGLQAQGDLIVVPLAEFRGVFIGPDAYWREVPPAGIEVLRSAAGGNPHTLVADPGTARWTISVADRSGLALGALTTTGVAYLIHPEHGASGIAPGRYVIGRQRERGDRAASRLVAD